MRQGGSVALGFDFGMKRIGVAVGQTLTQSARALTTLSARDGIPNWDEVKKLITHWGPDCLVVGLPLNMDGTYQPVTHAAKRFANRLKNRFTLPVHLIDERLSSVDARAQLYAEGGYRAVSQGMIDSVAAQVILQTWMLTPTPCTNKENKPE